MNTRHLNLSFTFTIKIMIAVWLSILISLPQAFAYPTYSCDGTGGDSALCFDGADGSDNGNCANCHGGFRVSPYTSNTTDDPVNWNDDLMDGHGSAYGIGCAECHSPGGRAPAWLNPVRSVGDSEAGCVGCHGRDGDGPGQIGDGLRAHHMGAPGYLDFDNDGNPGPYPGGQTCGECHTDTTPVGEGVAPATFLTLDIDPCNENGVDLTTTGNYGVVGLDNDGDGLRERPIADANGPYEGSASDPIAFDGGGSRQSDPDCPSPQGQPIDIWTWDFGDRNLGSGETTTHTYGAADTYDVTLDVTDSGGLTATATTMATISAAPNTAPTSDPNGPYSGTAGEPVLFDGSGSSDSDGTIVSYAWDFGDGGTGTGVSPSHTYAAAGNYTVTLTVTDDGGLTDTNSTTADIADAVGDTDGDGVPDNEDNCIEVANTDQRDTDNDGYGNLCDGDLNNDGDTNTLDLNLYKQAHRTAQGDLEYNPDADFNGDSMINTLDLNIYKGLHRKPPGPSCCGTL